MVDTGTGMSLEAAEHRITFHAALQFMEAGFPDFCFDSSQTVNRFFDRLVERIAELESGNHG